MNSNRIWVLGSVVVIIGLLAATWFLGVSPQLSLAALSATDKIAVDGQNQIQQAKVTQLKSDFEGMDALEKELDTAREVVPNSKGQAALIAEIASIAKKNKITVEGLAFADPIPYTPGDSVDPDVVASIPLVSTGNFFTVPVTMTLQGKYGDVMDFVDEVQHGTRLVLIHDLALNEGLAKKTSEVNFSVAGETYIVLGAADVPAPAVVEAPVTDDTTTE
jgi:Tfp pilus assembly protein PilO